MEAVTAGASGGFGSLAGAAASLTGAGGAGGGDGVGGVANAAGAVSPEFVDGLSKRLTTAEMKGIIQITERGRRLESRASSLQAEKEDLYARLQVGVRARVCSCVVVGCDRTVCRKRVNRDGGWRNEVDIQQIHVLLSIW